MLVPFYILLRPVVYLLAVIAFWETAKRRLDSRWRFGLITAGLFVLSVGLSIYESSSPVEGVILVGDRQVSYEVAKAFLENISLFAIVGSLLLLLRRRLETAEREVAQLARIAANSADAIVGIDRNGAITSWNLGAEMLFGYSGEEMMEQRVKRLTCDEDWAALSRGIRSCLAEGFVRGLMLHMLARGRRGMLVEVTLSSITDDDGRATGISLFMRDVTEQKELEDELIHATKMAAVGTLASSVVSEFGNLLTVISGKARLGVDAESLEEAQNAFGAIESCALRAKSVTNNLLACARRQVPRKIEGRIDEAVEAAIASMKKELDECGVEIEQHYGEVPTTAFDREQMAQVFVNLIMSALQALRDGGGRITVSVACRQDYIEVSVKDDGPSIPENELAGAFEPFNFQLDGEPGDRTRGLGLFVCREIVKYHSGDMSVNTGDGETSVYLYLPIVSAVVDEEVESRPAGIHPEGAAVAVIDGDAMMRDLLDEVLSQKGFAVRSYANPASARAAGADADSRLVFVDVSSRTPEGREFIEELKKKDTSIVAIVGEAMGAEDLKSIRKDLAGCLQKPFGLDEINELCRVVAPEQAQREEVAVGVSR